MKKKILPILCLSALLSLTITSCGSDNNNTNSTSETPISETITSYYVSFYVDNDLYKTAKVKENQTVGSIIDAPTKEGYTFLGWKTKDGTDFDLETSVITSSIDVYASFKKNAVANEYNVEDVKDPTKSYSLVIGWYGKTATSGLDVELMTTFYKNLVTYLKAIGTSDSDIAHISIRRYGDADTNVGPMGELINADGDCDILLGIGSNITSTGKVEVIEKTGGITMGGKDRYIARVTDKELVKTVYTYMATDNGKTLYNSDYTYVAPSTPVDPEEPSNPEEPDTPEETTLNVEDTKDPAKTYSLVIGWYGKTGTSGLDVNLMTTFYTNLITYLKATGTTDEDISKISVRRYGDESTKVGPMGELINADGDCDIVLGVGGNLQTTGGVEYKELTGEVMMGGQSRYIARLTDKELVNSVYAYMLTENGRTLYDTTYTYVAPAE